MTKPKIYISEKDTQKAILDFLELQELQGKVFFWRSNSFAGKIQRPNGTSGFIKSNKKGLPDISVILKNGKYLGIEVKSTIGKLSLEQKQICSRLVKLNAVYIVSKSFEEFLTDYREIIEIEN
jgi:hypothetical protein